MNATTTAKALRTSSLSTMPKKDNENGADLRLTLFDEAMQIRELARLGAAQQISRFIFAPFTLEEHDSHPYLDRRRRSLYRSNQAPP
jgi:hypothetical protein